VCLYDRLGVGRSDSAPRVQTFASMADDLDGVISGLGLTRPVVVLGDALGAPIALTWVSQHEKDARAVVLLMPEPPGFMGPHGALSSLLPPKDPGDLELSSLLTDLDHFNDPTHNRESLDPRSWDAYLRLPPTSTPLYDLVGAPSRPWPASVDAKTVNAAWQQGQTRLLRLSSSSELITIATQADWPAAITTTLERAFKS
jgi:pimeloyl-ACP methyl ester carboxylesterase